jgi:hypothetical protein
MCTNYRYDWSNYVVYLITLHTLAMLLFVMVFYMCNAQCRSLSKAN